MTAVLWFRRDLRLGDLPALQSAAADGEEVLACFVLDPRLEAHRASAGCSSSATRCADCDDDLDGRLLITRGRPNS